MCVNICVLCVVPVAADVQAELGTQSLSHAHMRDTILQAGEQMSMQLSQQCPCSPTVLASADDISPLAQHSPDCLHHGAAQQKTLDVQLIPARRVG